MGHNVPGRRLVAVVAAGAATMAMASCSSADGAAPAEDKIHLGTTLGMSGPSGAFGKSFIDGQRAIYSAVNEAGGVNGRKIDFTVLDDGLDVSRAVQNVRTLIGKRVLAVVGASGAGSIDAIVPILDQAEVPFLFPSKSSPKFVNETVAHAFPMVPTYPDQAAAVIDAAFEKFGPGSVFLMRTVSDQNDAIMKRAREAIQAGGGSYAGTTIVPFGADVTPYAVQVMDKRPDYVLFTSAPAESTKIAKYLADNDALPAKAFLGLTALPGDIFAHGTPEAVHERLYTLAGANPPSDPSAKSCLDAMAEHVPNTKPDYISVFGCASAQMVVSVLEEAGDDLTSEGLLKTLESMDGVELSPLTGPVLFSDEHHYGTQSLPAVTIKDGDFARVEDVPVPVGD